MRIIVQQLLQLLVFFGHVGQLGVQAGDDVITVGSVVNPVDVGTLELLHVVAQAVV